LRSDQIHNPPPDLCFIFKRRLSQIQSRESEEENQTMKARDNFETGTRGLGGSCTGTNNTILKGIIRPGSVESVNTNSCSERFDEEEGGWGGTLIGDAKRPNPNTAPCMNAT
jgi:hypothetical protein